MKKNTEQHASVSDTLTESSAPGEEDGKDDKLLEIFHTYAHYLKWGVWLLLLAYFINFFVRNPQWLSQDPGDWGAFGDYMGGLINPAVGLLTVFLIIHSVRIQRKELKLSLDEFKKSNEALAKQNAAIARQSFEQTFFAWLQSYRNMVATFEDQGERGANAMYTVWKEQLSFQGIEKKLGFGARRLNFASNIGWYQGASLRQWESHEGKKEIALKCWNNDVYDKHKHQLDSMLRNVYRLIKWIDEQPPDVLSWEQKLEYISIVRAQMSHIELIYLIFNGYTGRGKKFNKYINRYALFDNLSEGGDKVIRALIDDKRFKPKAFNTENAKKVFVRRNTLAKRELPPVS